MLIRFSALLLSAALLIGCSNTADLDAVQRFGQAASDAKASFDQTAADYAATCVRKRELTLSVPELATTIVELGPGYPSPSPSPLESPVLFASAPPGPREDRRCLDAAAVSKDWKTGNDIILGYIQVLGAIAKVDSKPTPFAQLGDSLTAVGVTSGAKTAIEALGNDIVTQAIVGEQRALIAEIVTKADRNLDQAIAGLKTIDFSYSENLHAESNQTFDFYHCLIASELADPRPGEAKPFPPATGPCPGSADFSKVLTPALRDRILQQRRDEDAALRSINDKRLASLAYAEVLDGFETTHRRLFKATTEGASLKTIVSMMESEVVPLFRDVQALKKAVK